MSLPTEVASGSVVYNYFRYYDPNTGRFITSDPTGLWGGLNTYAYVYNNPLYWIDPYGLIGVADLPSIPQPVVDFTAGLGNAVSFGLGNLAREGVYDLLGWSDNVNKCSGAYSAGGYAALAAGGARLAYAGLARAGAAVASSARSASNFRNGLKRIFRGGTFSKSRNKTYDQLKREGKSDAAIRESAGRTNRYANTAGAQATAGGAATATGGCGCDQ